MDVSTFTGNAASKRSETEKIADVKEFCTALQKTAPDGITENEAQNQAARVRIICRHTPLSLDPAQDDSQNNETVQKTQLSQNDVWEREKTEACEKGAKICSRKSASRKAGLCANKRQNRGQKVDPFRA